MVSGKRSNYLTKSKIFLHGIVVLALITAIAVIYFLFNSSGPGHGSFLFYFLQASVGVVLNILPPVYFCLYFLVPKYLIRKKYSSFIIVVFLTILLWGAFTSQFDPWADTYWFGEPYQPMQPTDGMMVIAFVMLVTTLLNLSYRWFIQMAKMKQLENEHLQIELLLLRNQINPHFFFNTLNNLYALALEKSDQTPYVILKLSEMMRYTIYDCNAPEVPLQQEITYLENYITLQKIRHHNLENITLKKNTPNGNIKIAPMVLIVFLENAFKHGVDQLREKAFLTIELDVTGNEIRFNIKNNHENSNNGDAKGVGIENVKKRLELIYRDRYELMLTDDGNVFSVQLKLTA